MPNYLFRLCSCRNRAEEGTITLVITGLDNAGKTTLVNTLKGDVESGTTPSFGFTKHMIHEGRYKLNIFDLGGGKNIRRIWKTYLPEVHGAVFVVDAADHDRFAEARTVLQQTLESPHMVGKPLLVLANKQDLCQAAEPHRVAEALQLHDVRSSTYQILPCTAKCKDNHSAMSQAQTALRWLVQEIDKQYPALCSRVLKDTWVAQQEEEARRKERAERAMKNRQERLAAEQHVAQLGGGTSSEVSKKLALEDMPCIEGPLIASANTGHTSMAALHSSPSDAQQPPCQPGGEALMQEVVGDHEEDSGCHPWRTNKVVPAPI